MSFSIFVKNLQLREIINNINVMKETRSRKIIRS